MSIYFCPWCKPDSRCYPFGSFLELRLHVEYAHKLWALSQSPSSYTQPRRASFPGQPFYESPKKPGLPLFYSNPYFGTGGPQLVSIPKPVPPFYPQRRDVAIQAPSMIAVSNSSSSPLQSPVSSKKDVPTSILPIQQEILFKIMDERDRELQKVKQDLSVANDSWHHLETKVATLGSFLQINRSAIEKLNALLSESRQDAMLKDKQIEELQSELREAMEKDVKLRGKIETAVDNLVRLALAAEQGVSSSHPVGTVWPLVCNVCSREVLTKMYKANTNQEQLVCASANNVAIQPSVDSGLGVDGATEDLCFTESTVNRSIRPCISPPAVALSGEDDSSKCSRGKKWAEVLPLVMSYLDTKDIFTCARVCSSWRSCSLHEERWHHVELSHCLISSNYLIAIAPYCRNTESVKFKDLLLPSMQMFESAAQYKQCTRGMLEVGLEVLLQSTQHSIHTVVLINCGNMLTERAVWVISCFCKNLEHLAYISSTNPLSSEVIWSLGAGCRKLRSLIVPPLQPNDKPTHFTNRTLTLIGKCFPLIHTLCIGGAQIDERGLLKIAQSCKQLCVFELDHMGEVREQTARKLCQIGLEQLNMLIFTFTPVTPKALYYFYKRCPNLSSICVRLGIHDYFPGHISSRGDHARYQDRIDNLMKLKNRSRLGKILKIEADLVE